MSEVLAGLDWLARSVETTELKVAVTVGAATLLLLVLLSYRRVQSWISERTKPLYGDIASTVLLTATFVVALAVVIGVWDQTETLRQGYDELDMGGQILARAVVSFILIVGTLIFRRFVKRILDELLGSASAVTDHQREISHRIAQVIIWSVSLVVVLGVWIDDLSGLLVGAGFLGIVVGMAARQTLGTVLSGFVLMFDRPFEIGDWIEVEDREGIVTDISIVNTRIRSFDGEYVMVPNDLVASSMVTNRTKRGRLRIEIDVGVDYGSDVERAGELAEAAVSELEHSLSAPGTQVVTKRFGDSAIVLGVRFWIDNPSSQRRWKARTAAIGAIKRRFEDENIGIPFPQRELSGRDGTAVHVDATDDGRSDSEDDVSPRSDSDASADEPTEPREYRMTQPEDG
ncbi:mechanosensitive ion channel family protein [Natrarchaeobius halalkaliphilus]|uniref:Mechanosensitive ion channel family protein n=1 Tax=Natrarchaeobius halalkaliphilus TaxID=1679091 RepID=A0A3N6MZW5_9EURY|nr:mechanosensitive ion channel family protein [Natrarchaeobius halalkaliphilus]RQG91152.1 mechanosensitive ion channel family protein [Natrarchaeobius halalkaliphilus]